MFHFLLRNLNLLLNNNNSIDIKIVKMFLRFTKNTTAVKLKR